MKAIIYRHYGSPDVVTLEDQEKPQPRDHEVLVQVRAASINSYDWRHIRAKPFLVRLGGGLFQPKDIRLGADFSGVVAAIGKDVKSFHTGDAVFGSVKAGAYAEFVCVPDDRLVRKPASVPFVAAATTPMAALTALQGLRDKGGLKAGQRVAVHGSSGGVGSFAVMLAKAYGAEVTAVTRTRGLQHALSLGADHVVDSTKVDFTAGQQYDVILDVAATRTAREYHRALAPQGRYVMAGFSTLPHMAGIMLQGPRLARDGQWLGNMGMATITTSDLDVLAALLADGKVTPVIDRSYRLDESREAFWHYEREGVLGKIAITVS